MNRPQISKYSLASWHVNVLDHAGLRLAHATAFPYEYKDKHYLVTNWHVVTGKNLSNDVWLWGCHSHSRPTVLEITVPSETLTIPQAVPIPLWNGTDPLFLGNPGIFGHLKPLVDVAVIPITDPGLLIDARIHAHSSTTPPPALTITDTVFIVGYPQNAGQAPGHPPVWIRGSIASEPNVPTGNPSRLLVDARTRPGASGSPVIAYRRAFTHTADGGFTEEFPEQVRLVGVYSGRTDKDSDLGFVWERDHIEMAIQYQ